MVKKVKVLVIQSCSTACDPKDCSPPGSPVHGILQARVLEWVAIPFSRESSWPGIEPRSPMLQADSFFFFASRFFTCGHNYIITTFFHHPLHVFFALRKHISWSWFFTWWDDLKLYSLKSWTITSLPELHCGIFLFTLMSRHDIGLANKFTQIFPLNGMEKP